MLHSGICWECMNWTCSFCAKKKGQEQVISLQGGVRGILLSLLLVPVLILSKAYLKTPPLIENLSKFALDLYTTQTWSMLCFFQGAKLIIENLPESMPGLKYLKETAWVKYRSLLYLSITFSYTIHTTTFPLSQKLLICSKNWSFFEMIISFLM